MITEKQRTLQQNKALHKLFQIVSDEFNLAGLTVQIVLEQMAELTWTPILVKELWRQLQIAMLQKGSTTDLTTKEIDTVFEPFAKFVAEQGIDIYFPSVEEIMLRSN